MIPRFKADFGRAELGTALIPTRNSQKQIDRFERRFAALFEQSHAVAMPYGRTGLIILLDALGLRGDEVLCPAYTCLVVPEAIEKSGNHTVFVDCTEQDYNVDFELLERAVTPQTKALIATSIFGHPLNLDRLAHFKERHPHVKIIQDCAHSFGAEWKGQSVVRAGDAALFGLNISKTITSVFGGMVTTDDPALAARLRELTSARLSQPGVLKALKRRAYFLASTLAFTRPLYGMVNLLERARFLDRFTVYHDDTSVFMPSDYLEALGGFEARIGHIQTNKYAVIIARRKEIAAAYFDQLSNHAGPDFVLPVNDPGATYSHFAIRTPYAADILETCRRSGIQLGTLIDYHCPDNGAFKSAGYVGSRKAANWPGAMINLPVQRSLKDRDIIYICTVLSDALKEARS